MELWGWKGEGCGGNDEVSVRRGVGTLWGFEKLLHTESQVGGYGAGEGGAGNKVWELPEGRCKFPIGSLRSYCTPRAR